MEQTDKFSLDELEVMPLSRWPNLVKFRCEYEDGRGRCRNHYTRIYTQLPNREAIALCGRHKWTAK